MDESKLHENNSVSSGVIGMIHNHNEFCGFDCNADAFGLWDALKYSLLKLAINGAEKLFLDKKLSRRISFVHGNGQQALPCGRRWSFLGENGKKRDSSSKDCNVYGGCAFEKSGGKKSSTLQENERVSAKRDSNVLPLTKDGFTGTSEWDDEYVDVSQVVNSPPGGYSEFPVNFLAFFAVLVMKFMGFQFNLLVTFLTFPIWLSYFWFMFLIFPFQTLRHIRGYFMKKMLRWWGISSRKVTQKAQKSLGNIAMRLGCAFFWSSYVCFMLLGMLISGLLFGGLMMRYIVEKPIQTTKALNFDYTKNHPVAFVPIMPFSGVTDPFGLVAKDNVEDEKQIGAHVIPYNHKLQLTVSLVMPESNYNQKLGIFQVRVEFLSARGKVTASSSHPCVLKFKSTTIRFVESIIKTAPLLAGFTSESQILNIKMDEFTEGLEPTAFLKVMLEQRAEYKAGAGIPEIYAASLSLASQLPQLKRIAWLWRRTLFVWISVILFLTELMFLLVFCRPVIMPRGKPRILYAKKEPANASSFISWYKSDGFQG